MAVLLAIAGALLIMLLERWLWKRYWSRGLLAEIFFDRREVQEGDTCLLTEAVTNRKFLPLPVLQVKFRMGREIRFLDTENTNRTDLSYRKDVFCMLPYQKVTRRMQVECTKRGYFSIQEANLVTMNLLHTQLLAETVPCSAELYVCPGRSAVKGLEIPFSHMMGQCLINRFLYEDPFEFRGIRPYETTDSMKKINWNASAKTGELKVNQYHDTSQQEVTLLLNLESEGTRVYDILREESIRMIRTLTEWFAGRGIPVRILTEGMLSQAIQSVRILEAALPMPPPVAAFWHGSIFPRGRRILSIHWSGFVKKGEGFGYWFPPARRKLFRRKRPLAGREMHLPSGLFPFTPK